MTHEGREDCGKVGRRVPPERPATNPSGQPSSHLSAAGMRQQRRCDREKSASHPEPERAPRSPRVYRSRRTPGAVRGAVVSLTEAA